MNRNSRAMICAAASLGAVLFPLILVVSPPAYAQKMPPGPAGADHPKAVPTPPHAAASAGAALPSAAPSAASSPAAASPAPAASGKPASPATSASGTPASPAAVTAASPAPVAGASPTVVVIQQAPPPAPAPEPQTNNWAPGIIGIALLAAAIFYGIRYAQKKNVTVADALKKMGVEMPQDGGIGSQVPLKAGKPQPAPLPPLPSLGDLPTVTAGPGTPRVAASVATAAAAPGATRGVPGPDYRSGSPRLVGIGGAAQGETFPLSGPFTIGRDDGSSLAMTQDSTISRKHARIEAREGKWVVVDEGSSNGTFVNNQRVPGTIFLHPGDEIQVGSVRFRFEGGV